MIRFAPYGIDAPPEVRRLLLVGLVYSPLQIIMGWYLLKSGYHLCGRILIGFSIFSIVTTVPTAFYMLYSSLVRKFKIRDQIINSLNLIGNETILDVGCGRGLLLLGAAKKLTTGKAHGVDIWNQQDLSANSPKAVLANAAREHVTERIEVITADVTNLPFPDNTYDAVISMTTLHNIPTPEGREQALKEILRVLKPGGQFRIFDILKCREYLRILETLDIKNIQTSPTVYLWCLPGQIISGQKQSCQNQSKGL